MDKEKLFRHPGMHSGRKAVLREMWQQRLAAGVLLFFGLSLTYIFFQTNYILSIIGLTASVLGIKYVYQTNLIHKVEDTPIMQLLQHQTRLQQASQALLPDLQAALCGSNFLHRI